MEGGAAAFAPAPTAQPRPAPETTLRLNTSAAPSPSKSSASTSPSGTDYRLVQKVCPDYNYHSDTPYYYLGDLGRPQRAGQGWKDRPAHTGSHLSGYWAGKGVGLRQGAPGGEEEAKCGRTGSQVVGKGLQVLAPT